MILIRFFLKMIVLVNALSWFYANPLSVDPAFFEAPRSEEDSNGNVGNTPKEMFCNVGYTVIKTGAICLGATFGVTLAIYLVTSNKEAIIGALASTWDKFGKLTAPGSGPFP